MLMNSERIFWTGLGLLAVAAILASRPNCNRGCRTLAQHLIEHGIDDIVTAFLV